jgi:hypothetical protein
MRKLTPEPLAFGIARWLLPGTTDLYLLWPGPGDGIYMVKGDGRGGLHKRVEHRTASGVYATVRQAQRAVDAFLEAAEKEDDLEQQS